MRRIHLYISSLIVASCVTGGCSLKDAEDSITICGEGEINCLDIDEHLDSVGCIKGYCRISACKKGYHVHKNEMACESDTNHICGPKQENCESLGLQCSNGECRTECDESLTQCPNGCFDITKDKDHCGDCSTKCDDIAHGYSKCEDAKCVVYCEKGYIQNGNSCEEKPNIISNADEPVCEDRPVLNGRCACAPGADACTVTCDEGFKYDGESRCLCEPVEYEHGACECTDENAVCVDHCEPGYEGEKCAECADGWGMYIGGGQCDRLCRDHIDCVEWITDDNSIGQCEEKTGMCSVVQCEGILVANEDKTSCVPLKCEDSAECKEKLPPVLDSTQIWVCSNHECALGVCPKLQQPNADQTGCESTFEPIKCSVAAECNQIVPLEDEFSYYECVNDVCIQERCPVEAPPNAERTACVPESVEDCVCLSHEGWKAHGCDDQGNCYATECLGGYHLYLHNLPSCEKDTVNHCGRHGNDCNSQPGVLRSQCFDGLCEATKCDLGYHLSNKTCIKYILSLCSGVTPYECDEAWCCANASDCHAPYTQCRSMLRPADPEVPIE